MKIILKQIDDVQNKLFLEWNPDVLNDIVSIIETLVIRLPMQSKDVQEKILILLNKIEGAIINKDYLLISDLLEYELKPIVVEFI